MDTNDFQSLLLKTMQQIKKAAEDPNDDRLTLEDLNLENFEKKLPGLINKTAKIVSVTNQSSDVDKDTTLNSERIKINSKSQEFFKPVMVGNKTPLFIIDVEDSVKGLVLSNDKSTLDYFNNLYERASVDVQFHDIDVSISNSEKSFILPIFKNLGNLEEGFCPNDGFYIPNSDKNKIQIIKEDVQTMLDYQIIQNKINFLKNKYNYTDPKFTGTRLGSENNPLQTAQQSIGMSTRSSFGPYGLKENKTHDIRSNPNENKLFSDPYQGVMKKASGIQGDVNGTVSYPWNGIKPYVQDEKESCETWASTNTEQDRDETVYHILWNKYAEFSSVVKTGKKIIEENPEYGFYVYKTISLPSKDSSKLHEMIMELDSEKIEKEIMDTRIEIIEKMKSIEKLDSTKSAVFEYIRHNYNISNDPEKKMKASILLGKINMTLDNKKITFNKLSNYLSDMGLQKKRLSDGMHYYGLELKWSQDPEKAAEDKIKERNKQFEKK